MSVEAQMVIKNFTRETFLEGITWEKHYQSLHNKVRTYRKTKKLKQYNRALRALEAHIEKYKKIVGEEPKKYKRL